MTNSRIEVLPDVAMADDELGVEIVFLEPEGAPEETVGSPGGVIPGWDLLPGMRIKT